MLFDVLTHFLYRFSIVAMTKEDILFLNHIRLIAQAFVHPIHDFFASAQFFDGNQFTVHNFKQRLDIQ